MLDKDITPEEKAKELIEINLPIKDYMKVQNRRVERLAYWKKIGVQALIDKEQELVDFGEKVLSLLKEAYKS